MKKFVLIIFTLFFMINSAQCFETDYAEIYRNLEMPDFSYVHGIDPEQYYDNKNASYSIYPLFRLSSPLYFKNVTIEAGYYDLTPREHKGKNYLLFKDCGLVKYVIPVYKKELVPQGFYESHLPKEKKSWWQKIRSNIYKFIGDHVGSAQRKSPAKTYLEVNDLDNKFICIIVYYEDYRYYAILRTVQM